MTNPWFRLYSRIMTDPKVEYLSFEDQRHFVWLLCMKNEGYLDEDFPTKEVRERMVARKLGLQGEAFVNTKQRLLEMGLIDKNWQPISWDDLQFQSDSSKERVRKYRENKKKDKEKRGCNVTGNVTVTPQDKDKEEDKEKDTDSKSRSAPVVLPSWLDKNTWSEYKKFRVRIKAPLTPHAEKLNLSSLLKVCPGGEGHVEVINQTIERGWKGFFPLKNQPAPNQSAMPDL